jgi:hypothetical protein
MTYTVVVLSVLYEQNIQSVQDALNGKHRLFSLI